MTDNSQAAAPLPWHAALHCTARQLCSCQSHTGQPSCLSAAARLSHLEAAADTACCAGLRPSPAPQVQQVPLPAHALQQPAPTVAASPGPSPAVVTHTPYSARNPGTRRPLAQPNLNLNFTIKPKMPRRALASASAPSSAVPKAAAAAASRPQFVPVQSQGHKPSPAPQQAAASGQGGSGWPASLREYVTRALKTVLADADQAAAMHAALRNLISEADRAGERWSRDWDTHPLPSLLDSAARAEPAEATGACAVGRAGSKTEAAPAYDWVQARRDSAAARYSLA